MNKEERLNAPCRWCGETAYLIGVGSTSSGSIVYPYYCFSCGKKMANACFATKQEAMEQQRKIGELKKIELSHQKYNPRGLPCVVDGCGKTESEWHHFAPYHLFGVEADKWPAGYLCKEHHQQWHRLVTPNMSHQSGVNNEPEEKT